jgi:DNA gyrase subunit A
MSGEQKYKDSDGPFVSFESQNKNDLLVFTDRCRVYKCRVRDFEDTKASALGTYLPSFLSMDEGENVSSVIDPKDYTGHLLFFFENGKTARVELGSYETKTNRKKLTGAYSDKSPLAAILPLAEEADVAVYSQEGRALIFNNSQLSPKTSRATGGVATMSLKRRDRVQKAVFLEETAISDDKRYRVRTIPAAGAMLRLDDTGARQLELEI